jgi:hypothetical protein
MKIIIVIIIVRLVGLHICLYAQNQFKPKYFTVLDTSKGTRLLKQCSRASPDSVTGFWVVTPKDINLLEVNFRKILLLKAKQCCLINGNLGTLKQICYQYIGVIIKNKKYIYINAFAVDQDELDSYLKRWKNDPIIICDGGTSEWGVLFDLKQKSFCQLAFNGVG